MPDATAFVLPDDCCSGPLIKALAGPNPPTDTWTHKRCGCEWLPETRDDGTILWQPVVVIAVF